MNMKQFLKEASTGMYPIGTTIVFAIDGDFIRWRREKTKNKNRGFLLDSVGFDPEEITVGEFLATEILDVDKY